MNSIDKCQNQTIKHEQTGKANRRMLWAHNHSTTVKVAAVALVLFGAAAIATLPLSLPILGGGAIALAVLGGIVALVAILAEKAFSFSGLSNHKMSHHVYKPATCEGGKLYYDGHVPVLDIQTEVPFEAGRVQGTLLAKQLQEVRSRFNKIPGILPKKEDCPRVLEELKKQIPTDLLEEMKGLVKGFNTWAEKKCSLNRPKPLTLEELLLFHLTPDSLHFDPAALEKGKKTSAPNHRLAVACTSVVDRDETEGFVFGRNMDWMTLGVAGSNTLVIKRKKGKIRTQEVAVPGFVGTLTGMNNQGLALSMNVAPGKTSSIKGMPACLLNRHLLQSCESVDEVGKELSIKNSLGTYHLTVADKEKATAFHIHSAGHFTPEQWEQKKPIFVTNTCSDGSGAFHHSPERLHQLRTHFSQNGARGALVEESLALPIVNNMLTAHRVVMKPKEGKMFVAFNNAFAGKDSLHEVRMA